ncbi:MAG: glycosyltransferase [Methanomassiliicoccales archaeon]|nr:glycosyltransferase [Methanomassiliicoccales archaeon]
MRVAFVPGQKPDYVRNSILVKGLQKNEVEVVQCGVSAPKYPVRMIKSVLNFSSAKSSEKLDAVIVGFYGHPLVPIVRKMTDLPIIFDAFISTYDTLCFERKSVPHDSPLCKIFYWLDKVSCSCSNVVITDTNAHIEYFRKTFELREVDFRRVFVGADDDIFFPKEHDVENDCFTVFFHGTYRPLQGIDVIVKAADILKAENIVFKLIGDGPEKNRIVKLAADLKLKNLEFLNWSPYEQLPAHIHGADVCLGGPFSTHGKASRVIAGKTFQYLAMRKPVIVGRTKANKELLIDGKDVVMCDVGSAKSLADAVLRLRDDPALRKSIAQEGYNTFKKKGTVKAIGNEMLSILNELLDGGVCQ